MLSLSDSYHRSKLRYCVPFAADLILIILFTVVLYFPGLGELEFFRHTEADRTLIAWEMLETGDYLVPHLLGSEIFTKPPVYYWLLAGFIKCFGHSEAAVRLCSVFASFLLSLCIYVFSLLSFSDHDFDPGGRRTRARSAALIFSTFGQTMLLGTLAEIDMTYALFSALSLFLLVLAWQRESLLFYVMTGIALGFACLVKGPLVLVLLCAVFFLLELGNSFVGNLAASSLSDYLYSRRMRGFFMALFFGLAPYVLWLLVLVDHVGFEEVYNVTNNEFIGRYLSESGRGRGLFFYVSALISSMLPWSALFFLPLLVTIYSGWVSGYRRGEKVISLILRRLKSFSFAAEADAGRWARRFFKEQPVLVRYSWLVILSGFLFLSFAEAKSSRYIFLLLPFFSIVMADFLHSGTDILICSTLKSSVSFIFRKDFGTPVLIRCSATSCLLGAVFLVMLFSRLIYTYVYVPSRVAKYSVRPIAKSIESLLEQRTGGDVPSRVYQLDMFQRWLTYYLRRDGVEVIRLSEKVVSKDDTSDGWVYILLDATQEEWRVGQLETCQIRFSVLSRFQVGKDTYLLLEMPFDDLSVFQPRRFIPSTPEVPWPGVCSKDPFST